MSRAAPAPPPAYYEALGRLTAIASLVEIEIGLAGWAAESGEPYTEDWPFGDAPGKAIRYLEDRLGLLGAELRTAAEAAIAEYRRLSDVRHRAVHGVLTLDPSLDPGEQWVVKSARHGLLPMDHLQDEMRQATVELRELARRVDGLRAAIARERSAR